jgi:hypothetical protein
MLSPSVAELIEIFDVEGAFVFGKRSPCLPVLKTKGMQWNVAEKKGRGSMCKVQERLKTLVVTFLRGKTQAC